MSISLSKQRQSDKNLEFNAYLNDKQKHNDNRIMTMATYLEKLRDGIEDFLDGAKSGKNFVRVLGQRTKTHATGRTKRQKIQKRHAETGKH